MALQITQYKQDRNARKDAVPFRGAIWGYPYNDASERDLSQFSVFTNGVGSGFDAYSLVRAIGSNSPAALNTIRIVQPRFGTVVSCFADINMTFSAADNGLHCYLAIGTFSNAQTFTPTTSYSQAYLNASWITINGSVAPMTVANGVLAPQTFNLLPALYAYGTPNFVAEAFVLLLCFNRAPTAAGFKLNTLNVHMSVQGIK